MLYESYSQKIDRLAKIKAIILKYKFLILGVFLAIIATITVLLSIKGNVSGVTLSSMVSYGDDYSIEASAIMSDVYFEYRAEGETSWTTNKPILAGTYYVRAVSNKTIGHGYSKAKKFVINPRPINVGISNEYVVYGENPSIVVDDLASDDKVANIEFEYESLLSNNTKAKINSLTILRGDIDVTSSYNITYEEKDISFTKRAINVSVNALNKVYDGKEYTYDNENLNLSNTLAFDDTITVTSSVVDINDNPIHAIGVGKYYLKIDSFTILDNNGSDPSINYNTKTSKSIFSIEKRHITFETNNATKMYDGTELINKGFKISDSSQYDLVDGHRAVCISSSSIKSCGSVKNDMEFRIYDENDNDVTANYDIEVIPGTLEVTKRKITITTASDSKVYDGISLINDDFNISTSSNGLAVGHSIVNINSPSILNCGSIKNDMEFRIYDEENKDVTSNYSILVTSGTLQINKRPITIKPINQNIMFTNSRFVYNDGYEIVDGSIIGSDYFIIDVNITNVNGDIPIYVGNYNIVIINAYEASGLNNYDISFEMAGLEIIKSSLKIELNDFIKTYDGNAKTYDNGYRIIEGELYNNLEFEVDYFNSSYDKIKIPVNVGNYYVGISSVDEIISHNYDIDYSSYSNYIITPLDIYVKPYADGESKVFTHEEMVYTHDKWNYAGDNRFVGNDTISVITKVDETPINVGSYSIYIDSYSFSGISEDNYNINLIDGIISITKLDVTIAPLLEKTSKVYDGIEYIYDTSKYTFENNSLLGGDIINVYVLNDKDEQIINAGDYYIYIADYDHSIDNNYNITISDTRVKYTINKRQITFKPTVEYDTYSGQAGIMIPQNYEIVNGSFVVGEENLFSYNIFVNNTEDNYVINAGVYNTKLYGDAGDNYDIISQVSTFTINPKDVLLYANDYNTSYLSDYTYSNFFNLFTDGLFDDDYITDIKVEYKNGVTPLHIGDYDFLISDYRLVCISDSINENYNVILSTEYNTLTINPIEVVLSPYLEESQKVYDGISYQYDVTKYIVDEANMNLPDNTSAKLFVKYYQNDIEVTNPLNVGIYEVRPYSYEISNDYNVILGESKYYKILALEVKVSLIDDSKTYDALSYSYDTSLFTNTSMIGNDHIESVEVYYISDMPLKDGKPIYGGEYDIYISSINFAGSSIDNYSFTFESAKLIINKKDVTLELTDSFDNLKYNGMPHYYTGGFNSEIFIDGAMPILEFGYRNDISDLEPIDVGLYELYIKNVNISSLNEVDTYLLNNYEIDYSYTKEFNIIARNVVITLDDFEIIFGNSYIKDSYSYEVSGDHLANGDILDITKIKVLSDLDVLIVGTYTFVELDYELNTKKSNYNFTFNSGTLRVTRRNISLSARIENDSKVYDGIAYSYDISDSNHFNCIDDGIIYQDLVPFVGEAILYVKYYDSDFAEISYPIVNAGVYYVKAYASSLDSNDNFSITYLDEYVSYIINQVEIDIRASYITKEYTGDKQKYGDNDFSFDTTKLVGDDKLLGAEFEFTGFNKPLIDNLPKYVGLYNVVPTDVWFSGVSKDNYKFNYIAGLFEITPISIVITLDEPDDIIYDGNAKELDLSFTQDISFVDNASIILIPQYLGNTYKEEILLNVDTYDVDASYQYNVSSIDDYDNLYAYDNYIISVIGTSVSIIPRDVYVSAVSYSRVYLDDYTYSSYNDMYDLSDDPLHQFVNGDTIVDISVLYFKDSVEVIPSNVGQYSMKIVDYTFVGVESSRIDNYNIICIDSDSVFEITQLKIKLSFDLIENEAIYGDYFDYINNTHLYYEYLNGSNIGNYTDVAPVTFDYEFSLEYYLYQNEEEIEVLLPINVGTYHIKLKNKSVEETANFFVSVFGGYEEFNIKPREVHIKLESIDDITYSNTEFEYDGTWQYSSNNEFVEGEGIQSFKVAYSSTLPLSNNNKPLYAGVYTACVDLLSIADDFIGDINNYDIKSDYVEFNILPKELNISFIEENLGYEYCGYSYSYEKGFNYELALNDTAILSIPVIYKMNNVVTEPIFVGEYEVLIDEANIVAIGEGVYDTYFKTNYQISSSKALLTINKKSITLKPIYEEVLYNGLAQYHSNTLEIVSGELAFNDSIVSSVVKYSYNGLTVENPIDVHDYTTSIEDVVIMHEGINSTDSYSISLEDETFKILVSNITLSLRKASYEAVYGEGFTYPAHTNESYKDALDKCLGVQIVSGVLYGDCGIRAHVFYKDLAGFAIVDQDGNYIAPTNAGLYTIHPYRFEILGGYQSNYNITIVDEDVTLEILKRKVAISYNNTHEIHYTGEEYVLSNTDYLECGEYSLLDSVEFRAYSYLNDELTPVINAGNYIVKIDKNSVKFVDGSQELLSNYEIETINVILTMGRLQYMVVPTFISKAYDGNAYSLDDFSFIAYDVNRDNMIIDLGPEYSVYMNYNGRRMLLTEVVHAGAYRFSSLIVDNDNYSYRDDENSYDLIIESREITISINNIEDFEFNNTNFTVDRFNSYSITDGSIIEGDKIALNFAYFGSITGEDNYALHAQEYILRADSTIMLYDESNNYKSEYNSDYKLSENSILETTFTITRKNIVIKLLDKSKIYDGEMYIYDSILNGMPNYEIDGFVTDDLFEFDVMYYQNGITINPIEIGEYEMHIDLSSINTIYACGLELDDYSFESEGQATLSISIINLEYELYDETVTYTGNSAKFSNYSILGNTMNYEIIPNFRYEGINVDNDLGIHIGTYYVYLDSITVMKNGEVFDSSNIEICRSSSYTNDAILTIIPRDLLILGDELNYTYSSANIYDTSYSYFQAYGLVSNDTISYSFHLQDDEGNTILEAINVGKYYVVLDSISFSLSNNSDYSYNLDVKTTLNILQYNIEVTPLFSGQKEYDGIEVDFVGSYEFITSPIEDLEISAIYGIYKDVDKNTKLLTILDAYTYYIFVDSLTMLNSDGLDISYNYNLISNYSTYTITRRAVEITTGSGEYYFDGGHKYQKDGFSATANLLENHTVMWDGKAPAAEDVHIKPGVYENKLGFIITDELDNDVSHNYEVTKTNYGTITIYKRSLTITTGSNKDYKGSTLTLSEDGTICYNGLGKGLKVDYTSVVDNTTVFDGKDYNALVESNSIADGLAVKYRKFPVLYMASDESTTNSCEAYITDGLIDEYYDIELIFGSIKLSRMKINVSINLENNEFSFNNSVYDLRNENRYLWSDINGKKVSLLSHSTIIDYEESIKVYKLKDVLINDDLLDLNNYDLVTLDDVIMAGKYLVIPNYKLNGYGNTTVNGIVKNEYVGLESNYDITYINPISIEGNRIVIEELEELANYFITINKVGISITSPSESAPYSGPNQVLKNTNLYYFTEIDCPFIGAVKCDENYITELSAREEVNTKENYFVPIILDESGIDITNSFDITCIYGTLSIDKEIYLVSTGLYSYTGDVIDALPFVQAVNKNYVLMEGISVEIDMEGPYDVNLNETTMIDIGDYYFKYDLSSLKLYSNGVDVTEAFIDYVDVMVSIDGYFSCSVRKATLIVKPVEVEFNYDGTGHSYEDYFTSDMKMFEYVNIPTGVTTINSDILSDKYTIELITKYTNNHKVTLSSAATNSIYGVKVYNEIGECVYHVETIYDRTLKMDVTVLYVSTMSDYFTFVYDEASYLEVGYDEAYYKSSYFTAKFKINKYCLNITSGGATFMYDGLSHSYRDYMLTKENEIFLQSLGHHAEVSSSTTVTNAGTYYNVITLKVYDQDGNEIKNAYTKKDVSRGKIIITKKELSMDGFYYSKTFDEEALEVPEENIINYLSASLVEGHYISSVTWVISSNEGNNMTLRGVGYLTIDTIVILDADGKNVTRNYLVSDSPGMVEII